MTLVFVARAMRGSGPVVALAGRRIDAIHAPVLRFPLENVSQVAEQVRQVFSSLDANALVCSAANGADLIALDVARELGTRYRIVLPCPVENFRRESVGDRPDDRWGPLFDEVTALALSHGDLVVLDQLPHEARGAASNAEMRHLAVNARIIDEALRLAAPPEAQAHHATSSGPRAGVVGVAVWDGHSRGANDITAAFVDRLAEHQIPVRHVSTLAPAPTTFPSRP